MGATQPGGRDAAIGDLAVARPNRLHLGRTHAVGKRFLRCCTSTAATRGTARLVDEAVARILGAMYDGQMHRLSFWNDTRTGEHGAVLVSDVFRAAGHAIADGLGRADPVRLVLALRALRRVEGEVALGRCERGAGCGHRVVPIDIAALVAA